ncbi:MAG: methyltransferase [Desulfamplus sp.]|nr:methyltransferase [Desulfamplus sp.]
MEIENVDLVNLTQVKHLLNIAENLYIEQPKSGYRFSIDPIILASDLNIEPNEKILDIGTGCGVMPLLIAAKFPKVQITAVELQKELAAIAEKNIKANRLEDKIRLINGDIRQLKSLELLGRFDRIISNPPYKKKGSGRINPNSQKAVARHEIALTLDEFILSASNLLKLDGILNLIYPADRLHELIETMKKGSIEPFQIKFIKTSNIKSQKPKLVLVAATNLCDLK